MKLRELPVAVEEDKVPPDLASTSVYSWYMQPTYMPAPPDSPHSLSPSHPQSLPNMSITTEDGPEGDQAWKRSPVILATYEVSKSPLQWHISADDSGHKTVDQMEELRASL